MDIITNKISLHKGRKIERIRKLRGLTQVDLAERLKVTKQAVSKLEQSENISDDKLKEVADALEVTFEGLRDFSEEKVLYNTNNFYENCGVQSSNISANVENLTIPNDKLFALFEKELKQQRKEFFALLKQLND